MLKSLSLSVALLCASGAFATAMASDRLYESLSVTNLKLQPVELQQYRGRIVLLNFWASWCPPCVQEMPSMQRLQDHFSPDQFQILAVNMGESSRTIAAFFSKQKFTFSLPVLLDESGTAFRQLNIQGMPSSFLLDRDGEIIEVIVGAREWDNPVNIAAVRLLIEKGSENDRLDGGTPSRK